MAGGHAWQGECMAGGHAWQGGAWQGVCVARGACMAGGMHSKWGGGMCGRYYEIQSMSRQYASYWNAFLFHLCPSISKALKCLNIGRIPY